MNTREHSINSLYSARLVKGFSLNDELRAYEGDVSTELTTPDPVESDNDYADVKGFYAEQDEITRSITEKEQRETFESLLKSALQKKSKAIPVGRSRMRREICMSQLPDGMRREISHYMYSSRGE